MRFAFSEEQEAFRETLRRYFEDRAPAAEARRLMETPEGWERAGWARVNAEMGLAAIAIPEEYGGQGFGLSEQCVALEEMGRALLCAPFFATAALAAPAIGHAGTEAQKRALLPGIASGETVATLACAGARGRWEPGDAAVAAEKAGAGWRLHGVESYVPDGHTADLVVALARAPGTAGEDGLSLFVVDGGAAGLERRPLETVDRTRKLARLSFDGVEAELLGAEGAGAAAAEKVLVRAAICLASEAVGGAERLREDAMAYAAMRVQFGRSVASFQATKHKAADMLMDVELAKSAARYAAAAFDEGDTDIAAIASLAKAGAADAYMRVALHAIQIHGGIGFTWDNDTHLWFKRAKATEVFLGDSNRHRELLVANWPE